NFVAALAIGFVVVAGVAGTASAGTYNKNPNDYSVGDAANGIATSRHNLGGFGEYIVSPNTTEICIFCHTPHHSNSDMTPLWNRNITSTTFTAYGDTIGGSSISTVLGPSLACLSCHDGVTTFDNLVNKPGKGLGSGGDAWNFTVNGVDYITAFSASGVTDYALQHSGRLDIGGGSVNAINAGSGLSDDHPVGVKYQGGVKASLRLESTIISTIDLAGDLAASATDGSAPYGIDMSQNLWSVAGFISDIATIGDLLRGGNVECGSCHDPHFNNKSWVEVESTWGTAFESNGLFLRRVQGNSGSGVCRTCHEK
ncbi:MAG: hypothetical protein IME99_02345, partial [Proteobacteria bacterium]|nr:hypothetical protein [Pseudomonadota bacterium]